MTADPIEYRIVRNLQTALLAIATASGYHFTVDQVAVKLDPDHDVESLIAPDGPRPFLVLEVTPERWQYFPASQVKMILPCHVHWVHDADPQADESRLHTYFRGCADIEQALAQDISRGGLAADTRIVNRTLEPSIEGARVWARVDVEVLIHRTYGAPNG